MGSSQMQRMSENVHIDRRMYYQIKENRNLLGDN